MPTKRAKKERKSGKWETNNGVIWHSYNGVGKRAKTNRLGKNWFDMNEATDSDKQKWSRK